MNQEEQINIVRYLYRQRFNDYAGTKLINQAIALLTGQNSNENFSLFYSLSRKVSNNQPSITSIAGGCYKPETFEDYFRILVGIAYNYCYTKQWYGPQCCLQECLRDTDLVHPWLDIDYDSDIPIETVEDIARSLYANEPYRIISNRSKPNQKYHVYFYNKVEVKKHVVARVRQLKEQRLDLSRYIDDKMGGLRFLYNIKPENKNSIYAPSSQPLLVLADLMQCMIKVPWSFLEIPNPKGEFLSIGRPEIESDPERYRQWLVDAEQNEKKKKQIEYGEPVSFDSYPAGVEETIRDLVSSYGQFEWKETDRGIRLDGQGTWECPACGDTHARDNASLYLKEEQIVFYCFNSRQSKVIYTIGNEEELEKIEIDVTKPLPNPSVVYISDLEFEITDDESEEEEEEDYEMQMPRSTIEVPNVLAGSIPIQKDYWQEQVDYFNNAPEPEEKINKVIEKKKSVFDEPPKRILEQFITPKIPTIVQCNEYLKIDKITNTMLIQSDLGTGKTYFALDLLNTAIQKDSSIRSVFLTCRRSLAPEIEKRMIAAGIEPSNYQKGIFNGQHQIIQVESLHKLTNVKYDYVIIDEVTSITRQFSSSTNGNHISDNHAVYSALLRYGSTVIGMDGTIINRVLQSFQEAGRKEVALHVNKYQNNSGRSIRVETNIEVFSDNILRDLQKDKKVVVASASKGKAKVLYEYLTDIEGSEEDCFDHC